jgi:monofunctional chorismate mutase
VGCSVVRGVRGAITVSQNSKEEILQATKELLINMANANQASVTDIAGIIFSVTPDLNAAFPAAAAREMGWVHVPLFDTLEINVPGALRKCIRALMFINTELAQSEIKHIYLREARQLRPDLSANNT